MDRRGIALVAAVGALVAGGAWWLRPPADVAAPDTEIAAEAPEPGNRPVERARRDDVSAKRAAIPRRWRRAAHAPAVVIAGAEAGAEGGEREEIEKGGVDPDLPLTPEALSAVADRMRPSIAACVDAWTAEVPEIEGRVVLAFQLGAAGVEDAWVTEHDSVPLPVLSCFSAAVYEQDWPAAPDGVEVTMPFEVEADGLAPDAPGSTLQDKR